MATNDPSSFTPTPSKRPRRPNYAELHSRPLPLETHPLPAFHPSNPLSILRIAYVILSSTLFPSSYTAHPTARYRGVFSPATCSVHVTDPETVRALWERGFFGKGSLSRSEPAWLEQARRRRRAGSGRETAEEATRRRREARMDFKRERARVLAEEIDRQLKEEGKLDGTGGSRIAEREVDEAGVAERGEDEQRVDGNMANGKMDGRTEPRCDPDTTGERSTTTLSKEQPSAPEAATAEPGSIATTGVDEALDEIENQEHLQLTFEEAFFLCYGLGVLDVHLDDDQEPMPTTQLIQLFSLHAKMLAATSASDGPSPSPSISATRPLAPDDPFLLRYVAYHHFRSLGWVVRSGIKFAVDFMLYNRGPVFAHAEFAVMIVPAYVHGPEQERSTSRNWWWLHAVNRVQAQVVKHLVLAYVEVPPVTERDGQGGDVDIGALLRRYKIREIILKRWNPNRTRD